jgi:plastocyanin
MRTRMLSRPGRAVLAAVALLTPVALGAAAQSANAIPSPPVSWTVLVGSQTSNMAIQGQRFLPGDITIDAGDSVTWQGNSAEIHTVTFKAGGAPQSTLPPFDPNDPAQTGPVGSSTMNDVLDHSSGILVKGAPGYTLTFPNTGTFTYYCLVHGIMMRGVVHVQANGDPYPYSQADYDAQSALMAAGIVADGRAEIARALAHSGPHKVFTGTDDMTAMVVRFLHQRVVIHKGERVRFVNTMSMNAPHTVTFGAVPPIPALFSPSGNPARFRGGNLNSGFMPPHATFTVTFKKVGKFHYVCGLHSDMGMKGVVVVKP